MFNNFGIVVSGALVVALFLIVQGLYGLRTGVFLPFLLQPPASLRRRRTSQRIEYALGHILPGAAIVVLLIGTALRHHVTLRSVEGWFAMHTGPLIVICAASGFGLWFLVRPDTMVRWVQEANPETPLDSRAAMVIVRVVAAILLGFAILILASILHSR